MGSVGVWTVCWRLLPSRTLPLVICVQPNILVLQFFTSNKDTNYQILHLSRSGSLEKTQVTDEDLKELPDSAGK